MQEKDRPSRLPYLYALLGNIGLGTMQILIKQANSVLSPFQVMYFRSVFIILISLYTLNSLGKSPYIIPRKVFRLVVARMMVMTISVISMFYCLKYLPVSTVTTLYNIGPILIFFIQACYFKRKFNPIGFLLAFLSFIGVTFIVQPEFIFGLRSQNYYVQGFEIYVGIMLIAAFGYAGNMLLVHILAKTVPPIVNVHQSNLGFILVSASLCSFNPHPIQYSDVTWSLILQIAGIVATGFLSQFLIIRANSESKPSVVMPFGYVSVTVGFIADVFIFGTDFSFVAILGIILTSTGLLTEYLMSRDKESQQSQELAPDILKYRGSSDISR